MDIQGYYVFRKDYAKKTSDCIAFMPERRKDSTRTGVKPMRKWVHNLFGGIVPDLYSLFLISTSKK
jgi:hypothetical protein